MNAPKMFVMMSSTWKKPLPVTNCRHSMDMLVTAPKKVHDKILLDAGKARQKVKPQGMNSSTFSTT